MWMEDEWGAARRQASCDVLNSRISPSHQSNLIYAMFK